MERVQKIIARAGLASRRGAETMIAEGRVTVNGKVIKLGDQANPHHDDIRVDGKRLPKAEKIKYYLLHKPRGVLSTVDAQEQMADLKTVSDLVPDEVRTYPVGRLDINSEGLILMTNDGEMANKLTHPRYEHKKVYKVFLDKEITEDRVQKWRDGGIVLPDGFVTSPCTVKVLQASRRLSILRVSMREGHKRQIREVAARLGHNVTRLIRTHIGPLELGDIPSGQYRELNRLEIRNLRESLDKEEARRKSEKKRHFKRK